MNTSEKMADLIDDDGIEHLTVSRSEIAATIRRLAAENKRLKSACIKEFESVQLLDAENAKLRATCEEVTAKRNMQEQGEATPMVAYVTTKDARDYLNTNDKAFWVVGWNECVDAMRERSAPAQQPLSDERAEFEAWYFDKYRLQPAKFGDRYDCQIANQQWVAVQTCCAQKGTT